MFWTRSEPNYEKVLTTLDEKIRETETRLTDLAEAEKKLIATWIYYGAFVYVFYFALYFTLWSPVNDALPWWLAKTSAIILMPGLIYYGRSLIKYWYSSKRKAEALRLKDLHKKQADKLEELKKKTGYYETKGLIERFDSANRKGTPTSHGQPVRPIQPNHPSGSGLRQRPQNIQPPAGTPIQHGAAPQHLQVLPGTPSTSAPPGGQIQPTPSERPVHGSPIPQIVVPQTPINNRARLHETPVSSPKPWYEKFAEALIGDSEEPHQKYALICQNCFVHNGLVLPEEYPTIRFRCMKCGYVNAKNRRNNAVRTDLSPPASPTPRQRTMGNLSSDDESISGRRRTAGGSMLAKPSRDFSEYDYGSDTGSTHYGRGADSGASPLPSRPSTPANAMPSLPDGANVALEEPVPIGADNNDPVAGIEVVGSAAPFSGGQPLMSDPKGDDATS
ncbi:hypothetical protein DFJ73DRAFT_843438 [Zopfochytrium polystomum]|nr:hypothetical protein DFJ73DRAFT_843438 [Zopfochytrium polystomum]